MKHVNHLRRQLASLNVIALGVAAIACLAGFAEAAPPFRPTNETRNTCVNGVAKMPARPLSTQLQEAGKVPVASTSAVSIPVVVHRVGGDQLMEGLKKSNFAVFVDGVRKEVTGFAAPDAPISVVLLLEYSKWTPGFGQGNRGVREPGADAVLGPAATLLSELIRTPDDYAAVLAFDVRPVRLTDFTNDSARLNQAFGVLLRNQPGFRENCVFDSLAYALQGGSGDDVILPASNSSKSDFSGLLNVPAQRKAVILVATGWDTFSKLKYGPTRKIAQDSGIPVYIIGTTGMFKARFGDLPGTLEEAESQLKTFAHETGGAYFPLAKAGEVAGIVQSISALLHGQYNLTFALDGIHDGKAHKIAVRIDVDGAGVYDDKSFAIQARQVYNAPKK